MLSETTPRLNERETRQSMLRVWLAISAVWVAFWLLIAALVAASVEMRHPFSDQIGVFALIVAVPPALVLALGALSRLAFEVLMLPRGHRARAGRKIPPAH